MRTRSPFPWTWHRDLAEVHETEWREAEFQALPIGHRLRVRNDRHRLLMMKARLNNPEPRPQPESAA